MKWWGYLICSILIFTGIFSMISVIELFNVRSAEYGTAITYEKQQNYELVFKEDFGLIPFERESNTNKFIYSEEFKAIEFDGETNNYEVLVNDKLIKIVEVGKGYLISKFDVEFKDLNNQILSNAILDIKIEFFASKTLISFAIADVNNSIDYLATYMSINGFSLKLCKV